MGLAFHVHGFIVAVIVSVQGPGRRACLECDLDRTVMAVVHAVGIEVMGDLVAVLPDDLVPFRIHLVEVSLVGGEDTVVPVHHDNAFADPFEHALEKREGLPALFLEPPFHGHITHHFEHAHDPAVFVLDRRGAELHNNILVLFCEMLMYDPGVFARFEDFIVGTFAVRHLTVRVAVVEDFVAGPADDILARIVLHREEGVVHHADAPSLFDDHNGVGYTVNEVLVITVTIQAITSSYTGA